MEVTVVDLTDERTRRRVHRLHEFQLGSELLAELLVVDVEEALDGELLAICSEHGQVHLATCPPPELVPELYVVDIDA